MGFRTCTSTKVRPAWKKWWHPPLNFGWDYTIWRQGHWNSRSHSEPRNKNCDYSETFFWELLWGLNREVKHICWKNYVKNFTGRLGGSFSIKKPPPAYEYFKNQLNSSGLNQLCKVFKGSVVCFFCISIKAAPRQLPAPQVVCDALAANALPCTWFIWACTFFQVFIFFTFHQ